MARRRTSRVMWVVLALIVGVIGLAAWGILVPRVVEPEGTVSVERAASFSGIRIPAEARNIRIAGWGQANFIEQYMRFEAPPEICLGVAAEVLQGVKLEEFEPGQSVPLDHEMVHREKFRDLSWFDLGVATHVVSGGGGPFKPKVWVDRDRGVFYYQFMD